MFIYDIFNKIYIYYYSKKFYLDSTNLNNLYKYIIINKSSLKEYYILLNYFLNYSRD